MHIYFDKEGSIPAISGRSVLDVALEHGIPITHICKGNARCSTCRIIVLEGEAPPRTEREQRLADKLGFSDHVRLSCQLDASCPLTVRRVIQDKVDQQLLSLSNTAQERNLAILFSDIRSFTTFSERHLPYDIVHILNRYFLRMGEAITAHHGIIDKYMGDGMMAIFGLKSDEHPAVSAYHAALEMLTKLRDFNQYLTATYGEVFKMGIGIHYGPVVVGHLGHPESATFTGIGDTVNVAARIESATKGRSDILISETVYEALGASDWESFELELKGKSHPLKLFVPQIDQNKDEISTPTP